MRNYWLRLVVGPTLTLALLRDFFLGNSHFSISLATQRPEGIPAGIRILL